MAGSFGFVFRHLFGPIGGLLFGAGLGFEFAGAGDDVVDVSELGVEEDFIGGGHVGFEFDLSEDEGMGELGFVFDIEGVIDGDASELRAGIEGDGFVGFGIVGRKITLERIDGGLKLFFHESDEGGALNVADILKVEVTAAVVGDHDVVMDIGHPGAEGLLTLVEEMPSRWSRPSGEALKACSRFRMASSSAAFLPAASRATALSQRALRSGGRRLTLLEPMPRRPKPSSTMNPRLAGRNRDVAGTAGGGSGNGGGCLVSRGGRR